MKAAWIIAAASLGVALAGCSSEVTVVDDTGCVSDSECPVDTLCEAGFCVADDTYEVCTSTPDCLDSADECFEVDIPQAATFGRFCTNACGSDVDCQPANGFGGVCYALGGDPTALCYQQCDFDSDCYPGSVCIEVDLGGGVIDFICTPDN
ncbi:MAG: hypothetical protein RLO52_14665 [Sandaracinaceae bacterium]